jgi:16S rRNA processing protein RimM
VHLKNALIECGKITNTHGVAGTMRIQEWTDAPEVFCSLKRLYIGEKEYNVLSSAPHKGAILLRLEGIDTIEEAAKLKNRILHARREDIPREEGSVFIADLIGLPVIDADSGREYGTLTDVINTGASDIYEIKTERGTALMPAVPEFVIKVELDNGIFVRPIEGMFE